MKFSVLMSVYYKENPSYLQQAIDSVINQTVRPDEIVLVKDGKLTEELEEVINKYLQSYNKLFTIIEFQENKGLGVALAEGVKKSRNELIARMDTDDICKPNRFEKQLEVFEQNPNLDIVGSYIQEFEGSINNIVSIRKVPLRDIEIKKFGKMRNPFNHMTVMYKRSSVLKAGNYKEFLWNEDYYLWVRMILDKCNMKNINESLVYARVDNGMYERRGGIRYAQIDCKLQREYYNIGFVSKREFIINSLVRSSVRIIPNKLRKLIYKNKLRE
ncbi:glycosyltransferase [Clostridium peptidivorans]|uniref:glycosyltransferase n=1 Tax=Clostridium peptidivorans TaxID=100174 RepID=UPI000BE3C321|nr:glycosyltransferase [Clostridium peptidivorans]